MDYEYISLSYDYILCQHIISGTEFSYLVTPDNYNALFPVALKIVAPPEPPVRHITLAIGVFFDGTGNNAVNTRNMQAAFTAQHFDLNNPDAQSILTRNASEQMGVSGTGATSYLGDYSNIHWLNELYRHEFPSESCDLQGKIYVEGIGTRAGEPDDFTGLVFGTADTGVVAKTDDAVAQLAASITKALSFLDGKLIVDTLQFDIFGFSRGAAAARHFANRIQSEDRAIINAIAAGMKDVSYSGPAVGQTRFIGLFDTVAAIGTPTNGLNPHSADTGEVNLRLRPGVAQKVFQITAQNECRYNFALNSVAPAWPELALPGAHSDIGGGYLPQVHEDLFITRPQVETLPLNQPGEQSRTYHQMMAQLRVMEHSPSIMPIIRTNPITPDIWADNNAPTDRYGQMQKRSFAALTLRQRVVKSDWSKVVLRVMLDAAKDAGARFDAITKFKELDLPADLALFGERAKKMGKAARLRESVNGFSPEEIDAIAKDYIHCSAHWNAVTLNESGELQGGTSASELIGFVNRPDEGWLRTIYNMDGKKR
ncbi:T6SS phospholipase effector Tle1-like catalytic domain-containing protein [Scandinavium manionii]|uniref:T6SS phospholipase effector Tle1-like catalytic domain-containing protein n=1 Tax=Scandinavium manionii TaxID=2926520 RepID=UPI002165834E|nr:DUF2235 domain-containing protein [Scandinavium manionii]MCS2148926.1 DUF2235 domain-containing protein [Scandinavium manionii]